jgi:hypothetical protein
VAAGSAEEVAGKTTQHDMSLAVAARLTGRSSTEMGMAQTPN